MENYIEIPIDIKFNAHWFNELKEALSVYHPSWQEKHFHITVVFFNEIAHEEIKKLNVRINLALRDFQPIGLEFGKVDVFTTTSKDKHIVHLSPTTNSIMPLVNAIRSCVNLIDCKYNSEFKLHITLGRIDVKYNLDEIKSKIKTIVIPSFKMKVKNLRLIERGSYMEKKAWSLPTDFYFVEVADLITLLSNFSKRFEQQIADGAWKDMIEEYGFCLPGPQFGSSAYRIRCNGKGEILILFDKPMKACFSVLFEAPYSHQELQQIMDYYIADGVFSEKEVEKRVFAMLDMLEQQKLD